MTWNQSGSQDVGSDGAEDDCQDEEDDGVGVGCGCVQCPMFWITTCNPMSRLGTFPQMYIFKASTVNIL